MDQMDREKFLTLNTPEVAEIVRSAGSARVCVFPINGSRRWFQLEHGQTETEDLAQAYLDLIGRQQIELYKLLFEHGLDTLVTPVFGTEIFKHGDDYAQNAINWLLRLATHPDFLSFYQKQNVRVHFYGDYRKQLANTPYAYVCDLFEHITRHTAHHTQHRLFFGLFACDATETIAEISVHHHLCTGQVPSRRALIEQYYGEYIEKADIFIGFEKFNVFDYPMLGNGDENLYFTAAPSLYMDEQQIRSILYDHIYVRPLSNHDYSDMPGETVDAMRSFYKLNRETTYGIGEMRDGIWYHRTKA
jgi:hypothetical protein